MAGDPNLIVTAWAAAAIGIQAVFRLGPHEPATISLSFHRAGSLYAIRGAMGAITGDRLIGRLSGYIGMPLSAAIGILLVPLSIALAVLLLRERDRLVVIFFAAMSWIIFGAEYVVRPDQFPSAGYGFVAIGDTLYRPLGRYYAIPALCLTLTFITFGAKICGRQQVGHRFKRTPRVLPAMVLAVTVVVVAVNTPVSLPRFSRASWVAQVRAARAACAHRGNDATFEITNAPAQTPPNSWHMTLTCEQAFG
ncbi:MAG: hypothetical protein ACRDRT_02775 [Pseudonocardiaceae bacterium]